ncbi:septum site-determining protein MinC [Suttonella sp. R2A3]|uniref:septum site-determining protein MinC n=1 Tax=Suttonella sp. R2A3 TaxID=2908648 RepID=UPI001F44377F|nr:septum site-determining protein MinC [Suttonella sp. R2A3]UJF25188.1 septum site-determining protein MinC [Suttonella sp. R2A3]
MFKTRHTPITTIELNDLSAEGVRNTLAEKLKSAPSDFFTAMPIVADLQQASADRSSLEALKSLFADQQLTLIGLCNHQVSTDVLHAVQLADITLQTAANNPGESQSKPASKAKPETKSPAKAPNNSAAQTMVIRRHVRSGQRIYAQGSDLVIIGTVGAGAEIIADGNISVFGSLRGRAFAGAKGDNACFIYCSELTAEILSIAGCYQNMEQLEVYKGQKNCLITLTDDASMKVVSI